MSTSSSFSVDESYRQIRAAVAATPPDALPSFEDLGPAALSIRSNLPRTGLGEEATLKHLLHDVVLGLNGPKLSAHYYGFVTGGVLPIAEVADNIVTAWDQNVAVHLPTQSVATVVENKALMMLVELLELGPYFQGRTFTTGATASNVLGLACGREAVLLNRIKASVPDADVPKYSVSEMGVLAACRAAGVDEIQVLTPMGHSSLYKAASVVGLGRNSVKDVGLSDQPWRFDMAKLEERLRRPRTASIVSVSCGEVNTGRYATDGWKEMERLRALCDRYRAWLHVDGAFGLFSRALPKDPEFSTLRRACEGMELADSITGDCHKCLNVPYDCGFFLTSSPTLLESSFRNPNAAYLSTGPLPSASPPPPPPPPSRSSSSATTTSPPSNPTSGPSTASGGTGTNTHHPPAAKAHTLIPSPLNIGLENSRRFRALPVYAVLLAHGRAGLSALFARQVQLARSIAKFIASHPAYELLPLPTHPPPSSSSKSSSSSSSSSSATSPPNNNNPETTSHPNTAIIVLFRTRDNSSLNPTTTPTTTTTLVDRINESRKVYVSGTAWDGKPAARIASRRGRWM